MVDVVTNDMGYAGCGTCVDYSVFNPFNSVRDFTLLSILFGSPVVRFIILNSI